MKIKDFDTGQKILLIAEIGNNHEGDFDAALRMVEEAAACGVDAVKFQTYRAALFVSPRDTQRMQKMQRWELSEKQFEQLAAHARRHNLLFISTPLDMESARFLEGVVDAFKIASGDNTFTPLIRRLCASDKPVIISGGISQTDELDELVKLVAEIKGDRSLQQFALLHCVCSYPVPAEQANLHSISHFAGRYDCTAGYSDHTLGISAAVLSAALGARIIEKHFTLDKNTSDFRDHQLSADPQEMRQLVEGVREAEVLLGQNGKQLQECEKPLELNVRRSIVASRDLAAGHTLTGEDLLWLRPGGGLAPGNEDRLIGRQLTRPVAHGECFALTDVD